MDELPSEARALLELARDGHDPPDADARSRVRNRIAVAVTAVAVTGAQAANLPTTGASQAGMGKGALASWFGGKGWLATALLAGVGGATLLMSQQNEVSRPSGPVHHAPASAVLEEASQRAAPARPQLESAPNAHVPADVLPVVKPRGRPSARRATTPSSLAQETDLLSRAAQLLARGDVSGARGLLEEHRRSFPRPQLREEREGLLVLAHCMEAAPAARGRARAFVARAPASVLAARIARACSLNE